MAKKVIGYQIVNAEENIPNGLYSFQVFKTAEDAFRYLREHALNKGVPPEQCWFVKEYYEGDIEEPTYIGSEKKRYNVTLYYHTNLTVSVEAESEEEALALAEAESANERYTQDLLNGLQEDSSSDIELDEE
jgi:hypothetical protein